MSTPSPAPPRGRNAIRPLRVLLRGVGVLVLALVLAVPVMVLLALEDTPRVPPRESLSHADVARALALLQAQDPRRRAEPGLRLLALGERDLDLLLNHAAHRWIGSAVDVRLERGRATLQSSVELPAGRWLNLRLELDDEAGRPVPRAFRVGRLPLPAGWLQPAAAALARRHERGAELLAALAMVQRVSFLPGRLSVAYAWDGQTPGRVLAALVTEEEQRRLEAYHRALAALPGPAPDALQRDVALGRLLQPLFTLAARRSAGASTDIAAAENRALLLTLALHATGRPLAALVPASRQWPPLPARRVTLSGREDFAQHFLVSAVLAADTTSPLSRAVGIYKEVADSRGGSGFSFNDIAADRAGTRLGELALGRPRELQARLGSAPVDDAALMPPWQDLPEFLPEAEFLRRYGGVGAPGYERMLAEIDRRIAALPLLR